MHVPMSLFQVHAGKTVRVTDVTGGWGIRRRLAQLGILPGTRLRVVSQGAFGGPLLVDIDGRVVALGRGIAERVLVRPEE
ncbi:MAG: ferrous iron transport protein A [candidate division KSB1 bacterium]|nr:ferrous iron transport protein A [candidate division KSB1 bacterium]